MRLSIPICSEYAQIAPAAVLAVGAIYYMLAYGQEVPRPTE